MEVDYSLPRIRVLLDEIETVENTLEHEDIRKALKRLPLVPRWCLTLRSKDYKTKQIAKIVFGEDSKPYRDATKGFLEAAEMRLYLEVNGG